jgi:hypothetical protein
MAYIPQAVGSALIPKLLGCYEAELHGVIACALNTTYDTIIDIGCAEGYYAVGLALHFPDTLSMPLIQTPGSTPVHGHGAYQWRCRPCVRRWGM